MSAKERSAELNVHTECNQRATMSHLNGTNRFIIALIVYLALLLDNMLLTVIVPILPDYLASLENKTLTTATVSMNNPFSVAMTTASLPQQFAFRNGDGTTHLIMTKHPIPGKSMVNFTLLQVMNEDRVTATTMTTTTMPMIMPTTSTIAISLPTASLLRTTRDTVAAAAAIEHKNVSFLLRRHSGGNNADTEATLGISMATGRQKDKLTNENGSIGLLLAMKALIQLIFNPIVGNLSAKLGYRVPIILGTFCLLMSSLVFAVGESYMTLLLARAIQGIGSACIGVCGMSLVAQQYPEEKRRSKVMGIVLGSIALGVLMGYPFGGILYDLVGKPTPFMILSAIIFLNLGMQLLTMDLSVQPEMPPELEEQKPKWQPLFQSKMILAIVVAIWFSTSTMAILEPCLPIWLMQYLKPTKWQLGTVFIPDSVGYFVGTNFFGSVAYKYGQVRVSCICLLLVGISSILIPSATTVVQLLLPHFVLGLGIGIIDAALVPLLATFVDATLMQEEFNESNSISSYGTVYAIQQTSVSLAYCLAPLIGGELAQTLGFAWLMRIVGFFNVIYGPILVYLYQKYDPKSLLEKQNDMLLKNSGCGSQYKQLYNSMDTE